MLYLAVYSRSSDGKTAKSVFYIFQHNEAPQRAPQMKGQEDRWNGGWAMELGTGERRRSWSGSGCAGYAG